jgi:predicted component of type VI protein secretion system
MPKTFGSYATERRALARLRLDRSAEISAGTKPLSGVAEIENISADGVFCLTDHYLPPGLPVQMSLILNAPLRTALLRFGGQVMRSVEVGGRNGTAISFSDHAMQFGPLRPADSSAD